MYEDGAYSTHIVNGELISVELPPSVPPKSPLRDTHPAFRPFRYSGNGLDPASYFDIDDEYVVRQDVLEDIVKSLEPLWPPLPPLSIGNSVEASTYSQERASTSRNSSIYSSDSAESIFSFQESSWLASPTSSVSSFIEKYKSLAPEISREDDSPLTPGSSISYHSAVTSEPSIQDDLPLTPGSRSGSIGTITVIYQDDLQQHDYDLSPQIISNDVNEKNGALERASPAKSEQFQSPLQRWTTFRSQAKVSRQSSSKRFAWRLGKGRRRNEQGGDSTLPERTLSLQTWVNDDARRRPVTWRSFTSG